MNCLDVGQGASMGEGWSDFFALVFTAMASDLPGDQREIGSYVEGNPNGPGIRTHPYTTDLLANPLTFIDVESRSVPHAVGTVWAQMLWEVYWELVNAYGFDSDFYTGSGGNNLAIQLVVDALKLQACDPTFIEARDAVLAADLNETGAANECSLWRAFAKRGIGDAAAISSNPILVSGVVEDFGVPAQCDDFCGDGTLDTGEECDDGNRIAGDGCAASCEAESAHVFSGTASGGNVRLVVDGVTLVVPTSAGQSAAQVAANIAAAINADPTLIGLGVTAASSGDTLTTTGDVTTLTIIDNGLAPNSVPLAPAAAPLLGLALLALGLRRLPARRF
ncbi:MAG: M36 family metallopeptidase [Deltaproteobacteria bacterium]|nr:M36 family metallopeptidase [Deltaproteobacteria bacterium]